MWCGPEGTAAKVEALLMSSLEGWRCGADRKHLRALLTELFALLADQRSSLPRAKQLRPTASLFHSAFPGARFQKRPERAENSECALQDSNLWPLAPEANALSS
jgi:hypothetical protein